mgnify:CR=1 FL=1
MREMALKEIQQVSLDILKDVHQFCINNGIHYSLCYGTLLGAIRHNGFIPWDDDIDIMMPRPDYDRFVNTYKSEIGYLLFAAEKNDGRTKVSVAFARVCEMRKTYVDTGVGPWINKKTGVWIDVFPIDGAPDNVKDVKIKRTQINKLMRLMSIARVRNGYQKIYRANNFKLQLKVYCKYLLSFFVRSDIVNKYINLCKEIAYNETNYVCNYSLTTYKDKDLHSIGIMNSYLLHQFENECFFIISGYHEYLTNIYGDYMQLPPVEKRLTGHDFNIFYFLS